MVAQYERELRSIVKEAMGEVYAEYNVEVDRVIESLNEFADLGFIDQDIIDTGRFLNSKLITTREDIGRLITEMEVEWSPQSPDNGAYYAPYLWRGYFAWGKKFIQGRHFDTRAAKNIDVTRNFVEKLRQKGVKAEIIFDNTSSLP